MILNSKGTARHACLDHYAGPLEDRVEPTLKACISYLHATSISIAGTDAVSVAHLSTKGQPLTQIEETALR